MTFFVNSLIMCIFFEIFTRIICKLIFKEFDLQKNDLRDIPLSDKIIFVQKLKDSYPYLFYSLVIFSICSIISYVLLIIATILLIFSR